MSFNVALFWGLPGRKCFLARSRYGRRTNPTPNPKPIPDPNPGPNPDPKRAETGQKRSCAFASSEKKSLTILNSDHDSEVRFI